MTVTHDDPIYAMGRSDGERRRLVEQAAIYATSTPSEGLRRLSRHVRPGGLVAFQEFQFEGLFRSYPELPGSLYERTVTWVVETFRRAGVETNMGLRLPVTFQEAGLPWPQAFVHTPLAGGPDHPAYSLFAHVLESLLPLAEALGVATRHEIGVDTYADRLSAEAVDHAAVGSAAPVVGAWSTVPDAR